MMTMQHREGERESGGRVGEGAYHHCCRCATPRAPTTPGSALPPGRVPSPLLQHWCLPPRVHTPPTPLVPQVWYICGALISASLLLLSAPSLLPSFPSSASSEAFSDARTRKSLYEQVALTRQVVPYSASLAACPTLPPFSLVACRGAGLVLGWCWWCWWCQHTSRRFRGFKSNQHTKRPNSNCLVPN